jgi:hypothetical protein
MSPNSRPPGLTSAQIINIKRKEADAIADIEEKIRDANYKSAEDASKKWDEAAKTINSAFDSQISGLLKARKPGTRRSPTSSST